MKTRRKAIKNKWEGLSKWTQDLWKLISAIVGISGLVIAGTNAAISGLHDCISESIANEITPIHSKLTEQDMALMRIEIRQMISGNPEDIVNIESTAKTYFSAGGNHDIKELYSNWCVEYDPDGCHIILNL